MKILENYAILVVGVAASAWFFGMAYRLLRVNKLEAALEKVRAAVEAEERQ